MAALAVAPGADTDRGRQAVDDLTRQIDARYDILYEMFETAQLGATMNYAMHMSSCSFCKIRPDFSTLSPEVGCHRSFLFFAGKEYRDS
jgi:hypothetical protein